MSRIPKYVRGKPYSWYMQMCDLGLMYHPDDSPESICHPLFCSCPHGDHVSLFSDEECEELRAIYRLICADTNNNPCEIAYQVAVDRGEIEG